MIIVIYLMAQLRINDQLIKKRVFFTRLFLIDLKYRYCSFLFSYTFKVINDAAFFINLNFTFLCFAAKSLTIFSIFSI
jgi:hypothetical protein